MLTFKVQDSILESATVFLEIVISVNCTCAIYNTTATYLNTMVCPSFNQVISGRLPRTSGPLAPQNRMVDEPSGTLVSWGVRTNQGAMPSLTESTKHRTRGQLKVHKTQNQGSAQSTQNTDLSLTKVRPLFTLSHRGFDNSPLLIVFM